MNLKICASVLIFLLHFYISDSQELSCSFYYDSYNGYKCHLLVDSPHGLNNFTEINGVHLDGFTDDDVVELTGTARLNTPFLLNIPSIICERFPNIGRIDFFKIRFQIIDENTFRNCKNLSILILEENSLTSIDENSFNENLKLEFLTLERNLFTTLPEKVFANQQNLKTLILNMAVPYLPENIFNSLINLETLDLGQNHLRELKVQWFKNLRKLRYLSLYHNSLQELPLNVFNNLDSIIRINLAINTLKVIHSDSFGYLVNLKTVYFFFNLINAIDEKFIDNTGVESLEMTNNECINANVFDNSTSRQLMRSVLQTCLDNYKAFY